MRMTLGAGVALLALVLASVSYAGEQSDTGAAMKGDSMNTDTSKSDGMSSDTDSMGGGAMKGETDSGAMKGDSDSMEKDSGDHMMAAPEADKPKM